MTPLHLGPLVALALAAPGAEPDLVAMTFPPLSTLRELLPAALPPAPDRVYLETRSYGTVTLDHRAHLARRVACRACHGPGPVSRIEFTPRSAHESCRACHVTANRGPTSCRDCHVQPAEPPVGQPGERVRFVFRGPGGTRLSGSTSSQKPKPPPKPAAVAKAPSPGSPEAGASPSEAGAAPGSAAAAAAAPAPPLAMAEPEGEPAAAFRRSADLALDLAPGGSGSFGPALRLSMRAERLAIVQRIAWTSGPGMARMTGLLGIGPTFPLRRRLEVQLLGLGGVDMRYKPVIATKAALGASAELQWHRAGALRMLGIGLSALTDLGPTRDVYGERIGGTTISLSLMAGLALAQ
jgi:hypothetical protein